MKPKNDCQLSQAYFDGELIGAQLALFEAHLSTCPECQSEILRLAQLRSIMKEHLDFRLSDDADIRIRVRLNQRDASRQSFGEILDMEEAARFLSIPITEMATVAGRLPGFEIDGRLRFRKEQLLRWVAEQEKGLSQNKLASETKESVRDNIIIFPGG